RAASRGRSQRTRPNCCPDSYKIAGRGFPVPTIINEAKAKFTEEEYQLLKLGPRFIYNNPIAASRRQTTELAALKRKIETRFFEKKTGGCGCGAGCEGGQCNCKDTCSCKCDCKSCSHDGTSCGSACECTDCKCSVCKCST
ncbi:unnamed protein product, partial [Rotaria magnacalcarata]